MQVVLLSVFLALLSLLKRLMPTAPTTTWGNKIVQPLWNTEDVIEFPVALKASTVYPAGCAVGEVLGTIDKQQLHVSAALTGGSYQVSDGVNVSGLIQWNATYADVQAAFNAALPGPIVYNVAGGPLNGGAPADFVLTRQSWGVQALMTITNNTTTGGTLSVTHPATGTAGSNGTYGLYASGNSDGTQNPKGILRYGCSTDAAGNITMGGDYGITYLTAPLCVCAHFRLQDLAQPGNPGGIDATALTNGGWRLLEGAIGSNGILVLPL